MLRSIGIVFVFMLTFTGCPNMTFEPSPGGVEGRWSTGVLSLVPEGSIFFPDDSPLSSYFNAQTSETIFTFSGTSVTIEDIQTVTSGLQRASLISTTTATFDAVDSETDPALLFSNPQRPQTPTDAQIDQYVAVLISTLSEEGRALLEANPLFGSDVEAVLGNAVRTGQSIASENPGLIVNCNSSGCVPMPFLLDGDMLTLTLTTGFGGEYALTAVQ